MSLLSLNSIGQSVFELESENENVDGQTDRQTDVGHINLIGVLVTCNPSKTFDALVYAKLVEHILYLKTMGCQRMKEIVTRSLFQFLFEKYIIWWIKETIWSFVILNIFYKTFWNRRIEINIE